MLYIFIIRRLCIIIIIAKIILYLVYLISLSPSITRFLYKVTWISWNVAQIELQEFHRRWFDCIKMLRASYLRSLSLLSSGFNSIYIFDQMILKAIKKKWMKNDGKIYKSRIKKYSYWCGWIVKIDIFYLVDLKPIEVDLLKKEEKVHVKTRVEKIQVRCIVVRNLLVPNLSLQSSSYSITEANITLQRWWIKLITLRWLSFSSWVDCV